jgi:ArsR family transcriptional regulator, arsenate/arsenite/antimonite-responsive transcriptional repressor
MKELLKMFKSLSDETRLRILNILMVRECCVCEVMQVLEISQSRASRHLNELYDAGFLKFRREKLWAMYSIDWESLEKNSADLLEVIRISLENNRMAKADREKLEKTTRIGLSELSTAGDGNGCICQN